MGHLEAVEWFAFYSEYDGKALSRDCGTTYLLVMQANKQEISKRPLKDKNRY